MQPTSRAWKPAGALILAAIAALSVVAGAQENRAQGFEQQIARIVASPAYAAPRFGPARWLSEGAAYTTVEQSSIIRYDGLTGERRVLVDASRLVPRGRTAPLGVADYRWSDDGRRLLIFTNTQRVWRQNTRGDYWVLDLAGGGLTQLGAGAPESTLMFAKFSPDATRVAYVRANNVYVERMSDGRVTPLTIDGSETTINGTADWVYEEELGVRDGFRWSPDGLSIAYWQFDSTGVGLFSLINTTDALYPTITRIPYPKAGTTNSAVRIGVVSADGGETRWMQTPGDPRNTYLARLGWVDRDTVAIQQLNRLQNQHDLLLADARTGTTRRVFRDESTTWVAVGDTVRWFDNARAFLWTTERDGWRHVYRVPRAGGEGTLITRFDADITAVVEVDETQGWIYFGASPTSPAERFLYRSRLDGTGTPERVTPHGQPGSHDYDIAPDGRLAFHTHSRFDQPPVIDMVDLPAHRAVRALTDISVLQKTLASDGLASPPAEFFRVAVDDGVSLDGWMLKPSGFDPSRRYPVIFYVYGEPATATAVDRWGGARMLFHRALAEAGYVVVSVDNRGTPALRGAAWRKVVYGAVGDLASREQAAAVKAIAERYPFVDRERVGIWGWSGGGSNTLNAMFRFPDVYRAGVAVAPVPDQRLYDTIYQERYMGLPQDNVEGYRLGSAINFAEGLRGNLLVIHGTGDDNVHFQGTEQLINKLVSLGKRFDVMVYPNRTHAIAEGPGTLAHVYTLIARYFMEHLPAGAR